MSGLRIVVRSLSAVALLLGFFCLSAPTSSADQYINCDQGNGFCGPDDYIHYYCYGSTLNGATEIRDQVDWVMDLMENQTVMTTTKQSCTSSTDLRFQNANLGATVRGQYVCDTWAGQAHPQVCAAATVTMDRPQIVDEANDSSWPYSNGIEGDTEVRMNVRKTYCHEAGHSAGFDHHPESDYPPSRANYYDGSQPTNVRDCMVRQHIEQGDDGWLKYNQHHQDHLADFLN